MNNQPEHIIADFAAKNDLDQLVDDSTRNDAILDLLLADCSDSDAELGPTVGEVFSTPD